VSRWDVPRVAVDAIVLHGGKLVLVRRGNEPFRGMRALPGGFVEFGESLEDAVRREVQEETGLEARVDRLVGVYGDPGRDPRGHTISVAFALRSIGGELRAATDAAAVELVSLGRAPRLAFDHDRILADFRKLRGRRPGAATSPSRGRAGTRSRSTGSRRR